jgi:eukaryotic-like serine/threonine-protein kinase
MRSARARLVFPSLLAAVAVAAGGTEAGQQHAAPRQSSVEYLAHIPRLVYVNSILISPDGATVATLRGEDTSWNQGGKPLTLQVWSVPGGDLVWTAKSPAFQLLTFSPDGTRLVTVTDADLGTSSVGWESQVAFSPEGTILAIAGDDQTINLWDLAHNRLRRCLGPDVPPKPGRYVMQFVPDGLLLASVNWFQQVEVKLWNYPGN